jgi:hypothetical protein
VVVEALAELHEVIDRLAGMDPAGLSDEQLAAVLLTLRRERNRLVAVEARLTAAFDARGGHGADGSKTAAMWLGRHTRAPLGACRAQVRLARRLCDMPHTQAALAAGEAEQRLVARAKRLEFDDFVRAVRAWENQVDPDGAEDQGERDHEARRVDLTQTARGTWRLSGLRDAFAGTELATALGRIERELFDSDWAQAKETHRDDTGLEHLARTGPQRRADALVELARRAWRCHPEHGYPSR